MATLTEKIKEFVEIYPDAPPTNGKNKVSHIKEIPQFKNFIDIGNEIKNMCNINFALDADSYRGGQASRSPYMTIINKDILKNKKANASTGPMITISLENNIGNIKLQPALFVKIKFDIGDKDVAKHQLNKNQLYKQIFNNFPHLILQLSNLTDDILIAGIKKYYHIYIDSIKEIESFGTWENWLANKDTQISEIISNIDTTYKSNFSPSHQSNFNHGFYVGFDSQYKRITTGLETEKSAVEWLNNSGYIVAKNEFGNHFGGSGYDINANKNGIQYHFEIKKGIPFLLTENEIKISQSDPHWRLVVLHDEKFTELSKNDYEISSEPVIKIFKGTLK